MKFKRRVVGVLGIILSWVMVLWPIRTMAAFENLDIHNQVILGDEDDDELPPPPYTIPSPESFTPGTGG